MPDQETTVAEREEKQADLDKLKLNLLRQKREKREIALASVYLFSGLITNMVTIVSSLFTFFERKKVEKDLKDQKSELDLKIQNSNLVASSIFAESNIAISDLKTAICDVSLLSYDNLLKYATITLIQNNLEIIEREIFSLALGKIPETHEFFTIFLDFCRSTPPNSVPFCRRLLWSNQIKINFRGLSLIHI